jgi:hypothetical protein
MSKIEKEKNIVTFMIEYYCIKNHKQKVICKSCIELIKYAHEKLSICPFNEKKTSCLKCKIHCYSNIKREEIRKIMSYVGPRMIYLMPKQYVKHLFNKS